MSPAVSVPLGVIGLSIFFRLEYVFNEKIYKGSWKPGSMCGFTVSKVLSFPVKTGDNQSWILEYKLESPLSSAADNTQKSRCAEEPPSKFYLHFS